MINTNIVSEFAQFVKNPNLKLRKINSSRFHELSESMRRGDVLGFDATVVDQSHLDAPKIFIVKHNWAAVVPDETGEILLPYDDCVFEFSIDGFRAIAFACGTLRGPDLFIFVHDNTGWIPVPDRNVIKDELLPAYKEDARASEQVEGIFSLRDFIRQQIIAACIALEAEVACHEVIRAPSKLNKKRKQAGKPPISDFHVVDLARRHRVSNPRGGKSGHKVRLHFRRGHWRHFNDYKTWVKWCLVGDPDLGFVDKHYSL